MSETDSRYFTMKKRLEIALIGNHNCSNRGDCAILRGLIDGLEELAVNITVFSEAPETAKYFLNRPVDAVQGPQSLPTRVQRAILNRSFRIPPKILRAAFASVGDLYAKEFSGFDAVIFVGGSYFIGAYGASKYYLPFAFHAAGIPFVLCGHSIGPFENKRIRGLAREALGCSQAIMLRDQTSMEVVKEVGWSDSLIISGADTAWLVNPPAETGKYRFEPGFGEDRPVIAVTSRNLGPFAKYVGLSQSEFEGFLVGCLDELIEMGYDILGLSTCTGFGGYHQDDRLSLLRIRSQLQASHRMSIPMEEFSDLDIMSAYKQCCAMLATRMHSAILSMLVETPAVAIAYEHKTVGLYENLGFPERVVSPVTNSCGDVVALVDRLAKGSESRRETGLAVGRQRLIAREAVVKCVGRMGLDLE